MKLLISLLLATAPAFTQDHERAVAHVRAESPGPRALIDEGVRRSPTIRALVDRLDLSDVIAYVRLRVLSDTQPDGRVAFLSSGGGRRYLVIEIACGRPDRVQLAALGHELRHAVEIADAPQATTPSALAAYFARIGTRLSLGWDQRFETSAAIAAGRQVRAEL